MKFVEYQGQRFDLSKAYEDFHDYKDDQANLTPAQVQHAESLMRSARFGPRFKTSGDLDAALATLEFPGYGLFYANQLGAHVDPKLELVYVEVPARNLNRYMRSSGRPTDRSWSWLISWLQPILRLRA